MSIIPNRAALQFTQLRTRPSKQKIDSIDAISALRPAEEPPLLFSSANTSREDIIKVSGQEPHQFTRARRNGNSTSRAPLLRLLVSFKVKMASDRISATFEGRTVFITGGSGFLGKALVEKLLRRCPQIGTIYLLLRPKKGKSPEERLDDIFSNMLFEPLKKQNPGVFSKCKPVPGDVTSEGLGISPELRRVLCEEVEFIFHSAASTRFDDSVRVAARMNTRGTKYVLDLAAECKELKTLVHVSTAYAHPHEKILFEKPYPPPADPEEVLRNINFDSTDESEEKIHLGFLGTCPNTYTFTKALAEELVVRQMSKLPVLIVRPSIVCPTLEEPFSGWCNTLQGPMGLFVGAGKGVIRSMYVRADSRSDFIPADVVINAMLSATWRFCTYNKEQRFFNLTASSKYSKTWEEIIDLGKEVVTNEIPFNGIVWYPGGSLKKSKLVHNICFYLFQIIPAILIDALLMVLGYKPILYQIQRRIQKGSEMLEYYTTKEWEFNNANMLGMRDLMNPTEKEIYRLDGENFDIKKYFTNCILGVRRNNLKETDDMLPAAKRNLKIMWCVDWIFKLLLVGVLLNYLNRWFLHVL